MLSVEKNFHKNFITLHSNSWCFLSVIVSLKAQA